MGEFKNQDGTGKTGQQDDKAAFGQFDKEQQQQDQGEIRKEESETDELAEEKGDKTL